MITPDVAIPVAYGIGYAISVRPAARYNASDTTRCHGEAKCGHAPDYRFAYDEECEREGCRYTYGDDDMGRGYEACRSNHLLGCWRLPERVEARDLRAGLFMAVFWPLFLMWCVWKGFDKYANAGSPLPGVESKREIMSSREMKEVNEAYEREVGH